MTWVSLWKWKIVHWLLPHWRSGRQNHISAQPQPTGFFFLLNTNRDLWQESAKRENITIANTGLIWGHLGLNTLDSWSTHGTCFNELIYLLPVLDSRLPWKVANFSWPESLVGLTSWVDSLEGLFPARFWSHLRDVRLRFRQEEVIKESSSVFSPIKGKISPFEDNQPRGGRYSNSLKPSKPFWCHSRIFKSCTLDFTSKPWERKMTSSEWMRNIRWLE